MLNFKKLIKKTPQQSPVDVMREEYERLCQQRDTVNERTAPLQRRLDAVNANIQALSVEAERVAAEIQAVRGGESWLHLKKQIGVMAKALSGTR